MYMNTTDLIHALGGEAEVVWRPTQNTSLWGNLGLRRVTNRETGHQVPSEPRLRANLGGRLLFDSGLLVDLALHYVSEYEFPLVDPENSLSPHELVSLGDAVLLIGRLGYRLKPGEDQTLEAGLTARVPLGGSLREYAGTAMPVHMQRDSGNDFGGEMMVRLVSFYLRASY